MHFRDLRQFVCVSIGSTVIPTNDMDATTNYTLHPPNGLYDFASVVLWYIFIYTTTLILLVLSWSGALNERLTFSHNLKLWGHDTGTGRNEGDFFFFFSLSVRNRSPSTCSFNSRCQDQTGNCMKLKMVLECTLSQCKTGCLF